MSQEKVAWILKNTEGFLSSGKIISFPDGIAFANLALSILKIPEGWLLAARVLLASEVFLN